VGFHDTDHGRLRHASARSASLNMQRFAGTGLERQRRGIRLGKNWAAVTFCDGEAISNMSPAFFGQKDYLLRGKTKAALEY